MKSELTLIPTLIVNPNSIVTYNQVMWEPTRPARRTVATGLDDLEEINKKFRESTRKANGNVSKIAKRKISKAIEYLVTTTTEKKVREKIYGKTIKMKLAFVTLTLPSKQQHDDREIINRCLNQLLIEIERYHQVKKYVWRAEKQQNGNIHFHILVDNFIPWNELRNRWNRITNKLNYVDRYQEKNGNKQPNSTDIHSTRKIRDLKRYLTKYLTKNEQQEINNSTKEIGTTDKENKPEAEKIQQTGRIWGCSHNLSGITGYRTEIDSETEKEVKRIISRSEVRKYESDYFTIYDISYKDLRKYGAEKLFKYFCQYLFDQFNYSEQLTI